ncbi:MAG: hypothetical protein HYX94_04690 [Chloroflexi bacterium]|nr:hypothetical protein [Chloroflexota bacterium]
MELWSKTAQLAMLQGNSLADTPGAAVLKYKSPWGTGILYIFVEGKGPNVEPACRLIVDAIGREFKANPSRKGSLTSGLTVAIRAAHHELVEENRRSLADQRATASVTCIALRENEFYLAQAGQAVAYARLDGQVSRFPAASSRALPSWSTPLGSDVAVQVSLAHRAVKPGDVILMASCLLATKPVESELPELLALDPATVLRRLQPVFKDEPAFSALAIAFDNLARRGDSSLLLTSRKPAQNGRSPVYAAPPGLREPGSAGVVVGANGRSPQHQTDGDSPPDKGNGRSPLHKAGGALRPLRSLFARGGDGRVPVRQATKSGRHSEGKARASVVKLPQKLRAAVRTAEAEGTSKAAAAAESQKIARASSAKGKSRRSINLRLPLFLAMLLLAGLILWSIVALLSRFGDGQEAARFDRSLSSAALTRERALSAGEIARSRSLLNDADQLVNEALAIKRNDSKARALKQKVLADLAKLNAVVRLPAAKVLTDLAKVEGGAKNLTNLIVEGEDAYILDRGMSRVYQFGIDLASGSLKVGRNTLVAKKGDKVGNSQVGDLVSILWMGQQSPIRPTSNLLLFDSARNLFQFAPGKGVTSLAVRGASAWQNPALALGYNANLYILDPSASQVWRYFPTDDGYNSPMRGLLENADIRDAVDFAIDGEVYVLTRGGNVLKFVGGRAESFNLDQLDKGLANPTAIVASSKSKFVYVLDAGNNRVVVFTKEGKFQRQLVGEALEDSPRSIFVDEERGKIYVLGDKKLYLSELPK